MASIKVIVSDPWDFITEKTNTNILYGTILLVEDDLEKILVELFGSICRAEVQFA